MSTKDTGASSSTVIVYTGGFAPHKGEDERKQRAIESVNKALDRKQIFVGVDLGAGDWSATPVAGGHCGDATCTKCDPMERYVDGMTVRECMRRWERNRTAIECSSLVPLELLTDAQVSAGKAAYQRRWESTHANILRAKQYKAREKERHRVVCDPQDEP